MFFLNIISSRLKAACELTWADNSTRHEKPRSSVIGM